MFNTKSVAVQSLLAFAIKIGAGVAGYVLFSLLSRLLGGDAFGQFSVVFSLSMFFGILGGFGQQIFLVKHAAIARTAGSEGEEKGVYLYAILVTLVSSSVAVTLFLIVCRYWIGVYDITVLMFSGILTFLYGLTQTTVGFYRIENKVLRAIVTRELIWRGTAVALLSVLAGLAGREVGLQVAWGVVALALLVPAVIHGRFVARIVTRLHGVQSRIKGMQWSEVSSGLVLIALVSSSDLYLFTIVLEGRVTGSEIGAFFAATKTVELVNMFLMAVSLIAAPQFATLFAEKKYKELQRQCNSTLLIQGVPSLVCCMFVAYFASFFLWIFDPSYVGYGSVLAVLCVGMIINSLTGSTVLMLQLGNMHWQHVLFQGGSLAFALSLTPMLVEKYGVIGASVGFVVSKSLWNILAIIAIRRKFGIDPSLAGLRVRGDNSISVAIRDVGGQILRRGIGK